MLKGYVKLTKQAIKHITKSMAKITNKLFERFLVIFSPLGLINSKHIISKLNKIVN